MISSKKFGIMLLILALIVSFLAIGCDSGSDDDDDNNDTPADTTTPPDTTRPDSTGAGELSSLGEVTLSTGTRKGLAIKDDNLFVCDRFHIGVFDISSPENPIEIGRYPNSDLPSYATGVAVSGNYLYAFAMNGSSGELHIADITDPTAPEGLGELTLNRGNGNLVVNGNYAFMPAGEQGVFVANVSDPSNPILERTIEISGSNVIGDVAIGDNYLFAAIERLQTIRIYDITDPISESFVSSTITNGKVVGSYYKWGHLFVANGAWQEPSSDGGFCVFDIDNPLYSVYQDSLSNTSCRDVYVEGNYAYAVYNRSVGNGNYLRIYGIYHPENPVLHHQIELANDAKGVICKDGIIFVSCRTKLLTFRHDY